MGEFMAAKIRFYIVPNNTISILFEINIRSTSTRQSKKELNPDQVHT